MKTISKSEAIITSSLLILISAIILVLILSGCTFERIEGNMDLVTENRSTQDFDEIISSGSFNVYVTCDSVRSVEVKAESNIQPYLYTISDGSTLRIGFKNGYNIRENYPVEIFIHTPNLNTIRLQGSGRIEASGFVDPSLYINLSGSGAVKCDYNCETIEADLSGSGRIQLSGSTGSCNFNISGSGNIRALDMPANSCDAYISGSGDIYTLVSDELYAKISGSGNVYYEGNPDIDFRISGSGKVIKY
jgi:hypothetical protein